MRSLICGILTWFLLLAPAALWAENDYEAFEAARKMAAAGEKEQAFLAYLKIPGAQHVAIRLARSDAKRYSALLASAVQEVPLPFAKVVEGDLHLAMRDRRAALACYRAIAETATTKGDVSWDAGQMPLDAYIVEPPSKPGFEHYAASLAAPFSFGPGSHRDNWLVRRFIALEAWDDAAGELARVWEIHRRNARPYLVRQVVGREENRDVIETWLVKPVGFDGRGLQFAIDYAFFLKKTGKTEQALDLLLEPLLAIDMDRNPNTRPAMKADAEALERYPLRQVQSRTRGYFFWGVPLGISRKEFIRISYGVFKDQGKEDELIRTLGRKIQDGDNRTRRLLARIRSHQSKLDEALELELEYIANADFPPLTVAYRRGLAYEDAGRNEQAAAEFEKALAMPFKPPQLPDPEEVTRVHYGQQARTLPQRDAVPASEDRFRADIASRLQRLFGALGRQDKAFEASLRQFEASPGLFADINRLAEAERRARLVERDEQFAQWLKRQLSKELPFPGKPNIYWTLGDYEACAKAIAETWESSPESGGYGFDGWRDRFKGAGDDKLRLFLETVVQAIPNNARARLALLDLEQEFEGPKVIEAFEALLDVDASFAFARGKGVYNRTQFRNYFDLAYRLMRLYEKAEQTDKLRALGLRIAAGEKPFGPWWDPNPNRYRLGDANELQEDLNGCLALVVHHADVNTLADLKKLWDSRPDFPAKRQLERRLAGKFAPQDAPADLGWANMPRGIRAIVSDLTVLTLARDEKYIYTGHPWGMAVFDHDGRPVTRIALEEAARAIAPQKNAGKQSVVWAGTPKGLMRINRDDWSVAHLWLHGDVPMNRRHDRSFPGLANYWFDSGVYTLALDGDLLWIGTHRNVQRLDTRTMELRAYSYRELHVDSWGGFERILPDGEYVWAECSRGARRYDRKTDTWQPLRYGARGVGLIAKIDGTLFGHVWLNDELRDRPCLIDRDTLEITPLLIEGDLSKSERCLNGPFSFFGTYQGKLVFGASHPAFVYDETIGKLRHIGAPWDREDDPIESILPRDLQSGKLWWPQPIVTKQCLETNARLPAPKRGEKQRLARLEPCNKYPAPLEPKLAAADGGLLCVRQLDSASWTLLAPPGKSMILGKISSHTSRYQYPQETWPFRCIAWDRKEGEDGLFFADRDGKLRPIAERTYGDAMGGNVAFSIVPDGGSKRKWLCTDMGLVLVDANDRAAAAFGRRDGLCGNRITSGVAVGQRMFFSSAWGDKGGGLIVADPATAVFTAYFQSDGLGTDKLAAIHPDADRLRLIYEVEYGRGGPFRYRHFSPGLFEPATGRVVVRGDPSYPRQSDAEARIPARVGKPERIMPLLGGFVIDERRIGTHRYLCGTRGLVILEDDAPPKLALESLSAQVKTDPHVQLKAEADRTRIHVETADDLARYAAEANPYVRNNAIRFFQHRIRENPRSYVPVLEKMANDELVQTRHAVARLLGQCGIRSSVPVLQKLRKDIDPAVRDEAVIALARLGEPVDLSQIDRILAERRESSDREDIVRALAPHATPKTFALLLKYPIHSDDYDERQKIFAMLGQALLKHREAADVLLKAYTRPSDPGPESNYGPTRFAQEVFKHAGKNILPLLYRALQSEDRVVRSNAARAIGEIGDRPAIGPLVEALDLESGLSRASIVWALGELKAEEALSQLAQLYVDARNDEKRRNAAGFRMAQAVAQVESQFETLGRLDAIASDWDELKSVASPEPIDPRQNEPLLTPDRILAAVRKIGPASSQEFYRRLAGEEDLAAREEAAMRLAEGTAADKPKNLPILRNMMADPQPGVQTAAAVSLIILGQTEPRQQILLWLGSQQSWDQNRTIAQLERVQDGRLLQFARDALTKLANTRPIHQRLEERVRNLLRRIPKR